MKGRDIKRFSRARSALLVFGLAVFSETAHGAETGHLFQQDCAQLLDRWNAFSDRLGKRHGPERYKEVVYGPNPVTEILDVYMAEFDGDAFSYQRVRRPLRTLFQYGCLGGASMGYTGGPADKRVGEILDKAILAYELDRAETGWGLIDLPEIDFGKQTVQEVFETIIDAGKIVVPDRANELVEPAMYLYGLEFDLVTTRDFANFNNLWSSFFNHTEAGALFRDALARDILDQLAQESGLERK